MKKKKFANFLFNFCFNKCTGEEEAARGGQRQNRRRTFRRITPIVDSSESEPDGDQRTADPTNSLINEDISDSGSSDSSESEPDDDSQEIAAVINSSNNEDNVINGM